MAEVLKDLETTQKSTTVKKINIWKKPGAIGTLIVWLKMALLNIRKSKNHNNIDKCHQPEAQILIPEL